MLAATGQPLLAVMLLDRVIGIAAIYQPTVKAVAWGALRMLAYSGSRITGGLTAATIDDESSTPT
ncbi:MAG: hypothetical protein GDA43_01090 [Hormoscilla sp. SP5CHS1]|nr:hypothetical protein [Hormoscilla sp. SP12CHS1]MBC6451954.1 hypothetical protein [Hormoscilla sp. SP5CHS1]